MGWSTSSRTIPVAAVAIVAALGSGCRQQTRVELTPKFTRATHPVEASNAHILSPDNYQKITDGMTQDQVRAVFGTPRPVVAGYKPEEEYELVWESGGKEIAVRFRGDKSVGKSQKGVLPGTP
jgi:hypothetical protein